jgi:hypothetical protein
MKKIIKTAVLSASLVALTSTAFAADLTLNLYGSSAQAKFWNANTATFMTTSVANGGEGCASVVTGFADPGTNKLGITIGSSCAANNGGRVIIRYTSNKSVEGLFAAAGQNPYQTDSTVCGNDPTLRNQANDVNGNGTFSSACQKVDVAVSDVASESFTQSSAGNYNGWVTVNPAQNINLSTANIPGQNYFGASQQPIIVPFSFYANSKVGITNLNRQQALLLFSGNIPTWSLFGPGYPSKNVVVCMRHAGSGTLATLDKAIVRGDRTLVSNQEVGAANGGKALPPFVWFMQGTPDMLNCINANGNYPDTGSASYGAIGYADSDAITASYNSDGSENVSASYPNVQRLTYNGGGQGETAANFTTYGYSAVKNGIVNGGYEFWSAQEMYLNPNDQANANLVSLYNNAVAFASNPQACPGLGCYWAAATELNVTKESDTTVPHF